MSDKRGFWNYCYSCGCLISESERLCFECKKVEKRNPLVLEESSTDERILELEEIRKRVHNVIEKYYKLKKENKRKFKHKMVIDITYNNMNNIINDIEKWEESLKYLEEELKMFEYRIDELEERNSYER